MSDVVKTLFSAAMIASSVSFAATIGFGNAGAIGAMFLVLICSCAVCFVYPKIEMDSCGCTSGTGQFSLMTAWLPISQECLTCVKPLQTAHNAFCIFLIIVFVAIFIYAITIRR